MTGRVLAASAIVLSGAMLCAGATLAAGRASAVWLDLTTAQSTAGYLRLESTPATPEWVDVRPGQELRWIVTAALEDAESGTLELEFSAEGSLVAAGRLTVEVSSCTEPFVPDGDPDAAPQCPGASAVVQPRALLVEAAGDSDGGRYRLAPLHRGAPRHLLVTLGLPSDADPASVAGGTARIGVGLHAADTGGGAMRAPHLAQTGADTAALSLLALGAAGTVLGVALLRRSGRRAAGTRASEGVR